MTSLSMTFKKKLDLKDFLSPKGNNVLLVSKLQLNYKQTNTLIFCPISHSHYLVWSRLPTDKAPLS